jgi:hypothetical protein
MFGFLKKLFGATPAETSAPAPYKVEVAPATVETPVVKTAPAVAEVAVKTEVKAVEAAPKKKPAVKTPARQKPATKQTGAKKGGRKPKAKPAV